MISEEELSKLSYPETPKIVTFKIPGPKAEKVFNESLKYETPTRVAGAILPFIWDEAFGASIKDPDGNIFIDMAGGLAVSAVGHSHPRVVQAIRDQSGKLMHALDMVNTVRTELAKKLSDIMPAGLRGNSFTAFTTSGSDAVETAIKYARRITGKNQVIAFQGGYHGVWYGSMALTTGEHYRLGFGPLMPGVVHMPYAYCYRCFFDQEYPRCGLQCAKYFDYVLNTPYTGVDNVAAVIIEPIQGEGGYIDPPPEFLKMIKAASEKSGALFIADEIQSGAGRTGKMWAIEHYDVTPDMLVWGKGVGGDQPLAGVTLRSDLQDKLEVASQPATFPGNALSCAVAFTNIDIIMDKNDDLMGRATHVGKEVKERLTKAAKDSKVIDEVRGKGFMLAAELVKDKQTREPVNRNVLPDIMFKLRDRGVLAVLCGRNHNVLRFMPPLVTTRQQFNRAVDEFLDIVKNNEEDYGK